MLTSVVHFLLNTLYHFITFLDSVIYAYFKLEMDQELPYTYGKVGWGHLAPLQVPFQVRGRPKMAHLGPKMA